MQKRIDGIYKCSHPRARLDWDDTKQIVCPSCPYIVRPSAVTVGGLISITNVAPWRLAISADHDRFMVDGHYV